MSHKLIKSEFKKLCKKRNIISVGENWVTNGHWALKKSFCDFKTSIDFLEGFLGSLEIKLFDKKHELATENFLKNALNGLRLSKTSFFKSLSGIPKAQIYIGPNNDAMIFDDNYISILAKNEQIFYDKENKLATNSKGDFILAQIVDEDLKNELKNIFKK